MKRRSTYEFTDDEMSVIIECLRDYILNHDTGHLYGRYASDMDIAKALKRDLEYSRGY